MFLFPATGLYVTICISSSWNHVHVKDILRTIQTFLQALWGLQCAAVAQVPFRISQPRKRCLKRCLEVFIVFIVTWYWKRRNYICTERKYSRRYARSEFLNVCLEQVSTLRKNMTALSNCVVLHRNLLKNCTPRFVWATESGELHWEISFWTRNQQWKRRLMGCDAE
jgi:hypothetical protein